MAIFDLFSRRQADASNSGKADVYQYDEIPQHLRVQVKQIALDAIGLVGIVGDGMIRADHENEPWVKIERIYLREKGLDELVYGRFAGDRVLNYMRECSTEAWLDLLELIAIGIHVVGDKGTHYQQQWGVVATTEHAIAEINYRWTPDRTVILKA